MTYILVAICICQAIYIERLRRTLAITQDQFESIKERLTRR